MQRVLAVIDAEPVRAAMLAVVVATFTLLATLGVDIKPETVAAVTGWLGAVFMLMRAVRGRVEPVGKQAKE
jgi:hypothetical protein